MLSNLDIVIFTIFLGVWGGLWFSIFVGIYKEYLKEFDVYQLLKFFINYVVFMASSIPAVYIVYTLLESY